MCDHGHSSCGHEASDMPAVVDDPGKYDMHRFIDVYKVTVLNESVEGAGCKVLKSLDRKDDRTDFVESDCDGELLFNIPFTGHVKLTSIVVSGDLDNSHPAKIRVFKDREGMSFDNCSVEADQEIDLKQDPAGTVDYLLKPTKFSNVHHLSLYICKNFGADETKVYYIGLRGEYLHDYRQKVAIATYEASAIPKDHKGEIPDATGHSLF